ncbi:hypothetical protein TRAPUB_5027 [Trametes pubescens]|uniref:Uncharacterized protein n=1 Tax=Trametes pubescens TaxID=154538 RepID=A0A1M2V9U2_TRAPU|nr:hypothetical protein TRAPUB_5027 [Trametes pubescens]
MSPFSRAKTPPDTPKPSTDARAPLSSSGSPPAKLRLKGKASPLTRFLPSLPKPAPYRFTEEEEAELREYSRHNRELKERRDRECKATKDHSALATKSKIDEVEEEDEDEWDRAGDSDGEKSFVTAAEGDTSDGWSTSDGDGHRADELPRLR